MKLKFNDIYDGVMLSMNFMAQQQIRVDNEVVMSKNSVKAQRQLVQPTN